MNRVRKLALFVAAAMAAAIFGACSSQPDPAGATLPSTSEVEFTTGEILDGLLVGISEGYLDGVPIPWVRRAGSSGDARLAPVLVELTFFAYRSAEAEALSDALFELTGERMAGDNFFGWYDWLGRNRDIRPPEGYAEWKGRLYSVFDVRFRDFFPAGVESDINMAAIQWGGVRKDGIPPLENPNFVSPGVAAYLRPSEQVFGVEINGDARAYPLRIMNSHELANDVVGGQPVSLVYCTLCGSGILWDPVVDGEVTTFGTSGFLYQSNKLMYDRQTETLWESLTGRPVVGELVGGHEPLEMLPITLTTWEEWLDAHPDTMVLSLDQGFARDYAHPDDPTAIYNDYFNSPSLMFPAFDPGSSAMLPKTPVFGLRFGTEAKAYRISDVSQVQVINDTVAGNDVVVTGNEEAGAARAYRRSGLVFEKGPDQRTLLDGDGRMWRITEDALLPPERSGLPPLKRLPAHDAFWFGWVSFFPETGLYEPAG